MTSETYADGQAIEHGDHVRLTIDGFTTEGAVIRPDACLRKVYLRYRTGAVNRFGEAIECAGRFKPADLELLRRGE